MLKNLFIIIDGMYTDKTPDIKKITSQTFLKIIISQRAQSCLNIP